MHVPCVSSTIMTIAVFILHELLHVDFSLSENLSEVHYMHCNEVSI